MSLKKKVQTAGDEDDEPRLASNATLRK